MGEIIVIEWLFLRDIQSSSYRIYFSATIKKETVKYICKHMLDMKYNQLFTLIKNKVLSAIFSIISISDHQFDKSN